MSPTAANENEPLPANHWWDRVKPYVEILGVCLLAVYTFFTIKMYYVNKEAADAATSAATTAKIHSTHRTSHSKRRNALTLQPPMQSCQPHPSATPLALSGSVLIFIVRIAGALRRLATDFTALPPSVRMLRKR
jgi:hypothetical protein